MLRRWSMAGRVTTSARRSTTFGYVRENGEISRNDLVNSYPFQFLQPVRLFGDKMPLLLNVITELEKLLPRAA